MRVLAGEPGLALARISPSSGVVEAGQQVGEHGLARAARADQRDALAFGEVEVDAVEDVAVHRAGRCRRLARAEVGVCPDLTVWRRSCGPHPSSSRRSAARTLTARVAASGSDAVASNAPSVSSASAPSQTGSSCVLTEQDADQRRARDERAEALGERGRVRVAAARSQ